MKDSFDFKRLTVIKKTFFGVSLQMVNQKILFLEVLIIFIRREIEILQFYIKKVT